MGDAWPPTAVAPVGGLRQLAIADGSLVVLPALLIVGLAFANGGYFPAAWAWASLLAAWVSAIVLLASTVSLPRIEAAWICLLALYAALALASSAWSSDVSESMLAAERSAVVPLVLLATLLLLRRRDVVVFAYGLLAAVVAPCIYALASRCFPDRLGIYDPIAGYRLSTPVGYWNGLGAFAAIGVLLALALAARARHRMERVAAGAAVAVLVPTMYFTFSRGGVLALAIGLTVAIALDPRRVQLALVAISLLPAPLVGVLVASRSEALTHSTVRLAAAARDGHRLAGLLVVVAVVNVLVAYLLDRLTARIERLERSTTGSRVLAAVAAAAVVLAATGAIGAAGGPGELARRAKSAFVKPPPRNQTDLNEHLLSFSGSWRTEFWRVALDDWRVHPVFGSGAGSYEQYWLRHRPLAFKVRHAHSLYLGTLAELGAFGLVLLVAALGLPLLAVRRARAHPLGAVLAGGYVAFLVHAGIDWDWELPALTLLGLGCGAALLSLATARGEIPLGLRPRLALVLGLIVVAVAAVAGLIGNTEAGRAASAYRGGNWAGAAYHASKAKRWQPWSAGPYQLLGEARLAQGRFAEARSAFRTAVEREPGDWELWFDLARASTGATQRHALARARTLNPLSPELAELRRELREGRQLSDEIAA